MSADPQLAPSQVPPKTHGSPRARRWSMILVPVAVLILVGFSLLNFYITASREGLPAEIDGLMLFPDVVHEVVNGPIDYETRPPYGGPSAGVIQDCGRYRVPIQDENAVASLAIGAVWIAYDPELPENEIDAIHAHGASELFVFVAPYPDLRSPIVLTAWGAQLDVASPLDVRIQAFIRDFQRHPDAPVQQNRCSGGVNVPQ